MSLPKRHVYFLFLFFTLKYGYRFCLYSHHEILEDCYCVRRISTTRTLSALHESYERKTLVFIDLLYINPGTYTQSHNPTVVREGGGWITPSRPRGFSCNKTY